MDDIITSAADYDFFLNSHAGEDRQSAQTPTFPNLRLAAPPCPCAHCVPCSRAALAAHPSLRPPSLPRAGLQGTNRPAHYHALVDEIGFGADGLQLMTYWMCYLYQRCTRYVHMDPAIRAHRSGNTPASAYAGIKCAATCARGFAA